METSEIRTGYSNSPSESNTNQNTISEKLSIFHFAFKYGIIGGVCYILIFFLFKILGLIETLELSFLNFIVLFVVCYKALNNFKEEATRVHGKMNYLQGYATSFFTSVISFGFLAVFMFFYLSYIDQNFMNFIETKDIAGLNMTPASISIILFFEGGGIGIIIALILMQYFKRSSTPIKQNENI
jgi:hypothetical protein